MVRCWLSGLFLAITLGLSPGFAAERAPTDTVAVGQGDIEAFNSAYRTMKLAVQEGRYNEAYAAGQKAFDEARRLDGVSDHETAVLALTLGRLANVLFKIQEAFKWFDEAILYFDKAHGPYSADHFTAYQEKTALAINQSDYDLAKDALDGMRQVVERNFASPDVHLATYKLYKGDFYRLKFRLIDQSSMTLRNAQTAYRDARIEFEKIGDNRGAGDAEFRIGKMNMESGQDRQAVKHFLSSIAFYEAANVPLSDEQFIRIRTFLSVIYSRMGKEDLATEQLLLISEHIQQTDNTALRPVFRTNPDYPPSAARGGVEGWVHVSFVITVEGKVRDVKVLDSDPKGVFDDAAVKAVSEWRYIPVRKGGVLVERRHEVVLSFDMA